MVENRIFKALLLVSLLCCLVLAAGCTKQSANNTKQVSKDTPAVAQNGDELWRQTLQAYSTADSYRDEAVLYLSYRLHGQLIQEPQPWAVRWTRDQKLATNLFNSQIRADGNRLGCYIFDIETANLDNQWLVLQQSNAPPLDTMFADGMARYFAGGFAEIPLDETPTAPLNAMTPPTLGWLTGQLSWEWLQKPRLVERLKDSLVDGRACFHVKLYGEKLSSEVWIDQDSRLVRQMTLPTELLDPAIRTAVELTEVDFFARMHKAERNVNLPPEEFTVQQPRDATPVQQFVALPEPFPCAGIGKQLPSLRLADANGTFVDLTQEQRPLVLVWISGVLGQHELVELKEAMSRSGSNRVRWIAVFSDDQAEAGSGIGRRLFAELRKWVSESGLACEWLYDAELQGSRALQLETLPAAVVVNAEHQVEYAVGLSMDRWTERLIGAVQRIERGEPVSTEMLADYQAYLTRYKKKLQLVSAQKLLGPAARRAEQNASEAATPILKGSTFSRELQRPGNLYLRQVNGQTEVLAFDGWQTVVRMNTKGQVIERVKLPIPEGTAATCLRLGQADEGQPLVAVWSVLGKEIFVLDSQWKQIVRLSLGDLENRDSVLDCQFSKEADGREVLWVGFQSNGLRAYDFATQTWSKSVRSEVESFVLNETGWVGVAEDRLWSGRLGSDSQPINTSHNVVTRVFHRTNGEAGSDFWSSGVAGDGSWELVQLKFDGTQLATALIGPQLFEQPLEPAAHTIRKSGEQVLAWADSLNRVHLFNERLQSLGTWSSEEAIQGIALIEESDATLLLLSLPGEIRAIRF